MQPLKYDKRYLGWLALNAGDHYDVQVSKYLAELMLNWGRLEYYLYLILEAIDRDRADQWTEVYFKASALDARIRAAKKEIIDATRASYPMFQVLLEEALTKFGELRERRNALMHGLWCKIESRTFKLLPMRIDKTLGGLPEEIDIDLHYVSSIVEAAYNLLSNFAALATEMLAHQWLQRHQVRAPRPDPESLA